jgi:hypothetical protein
MDLVPGGVDDDELLRMVADADKVGIDVPLGWPVGFIQAITAHRDGELWPEITLGGLRFRLTDLHVQRQTGRWPLSVSSDRTRARTGADPFAVQLAFLGLASFEYESGLSVKGVCDANSLPAAASAAAQPDTYLVGEV